MALSSGFSKVEGFLYSLVNDIPQMIVYAAVDMVGDKILWPMTYGILGENARYLVNGFTFDVKLKAPSVGSFMG